MDTHFRAATYADLSVLCRTFARSFWDDPVMRWLFPDDEIFVDGTVMQDFFQRLLSYEKSFVTSDVVAFALWIPPGRPEAHVENSSAELPPEELLRKFVALREALTTHTPEEDHWYLQMVGTHPDWQRRGIASRLIHMGIEWARRDGRGVYLETETVENVSYYRHLGFDVRSEWDVAEGGPHMWGMWRPVS
jgi:ribosomal protein S18 acetylase RimI-like enzyme